MNELCLSMCRSIYVPHDTNQSTFLNDINQGLQYLNQTTPQYNKNGRLNELQVSRKRVINANTEKDQKWDTLVQYSLLWEKCPVKRPFYGTKRLEGTSIFKTVNFSIRLCCA